MKMTGLQRPIGKVAIFRQFSLAGALLLGFILRLIALESRTLQYDDAFSIFLARRSLLEIISGTAADTMPPLYYILLHYWGGILDQVWFIRLLSVFLTLIAIVLVYRLGELWFGQQVAGCAAFLAAISPLLIYHGQDVRMYALLVAAQSGYLLFFTRIWNAARLNLTGKWFEWPGLVVCGAAAMYSHNMAIFVLVAPLFYLLVRCQWSLLKRLIVAQVVIGLLALPWLLLIPEQIVKVQKAWSLPRPGVVEILQAIMMFTASLPLAFPLLALVLLLSLQIFVMLGFELRRGWRESIDNRLGISFFLTVMFLPPILLFLTSYIILPVFVPRAFLISSLAFDLLAGYAIVRTWSRGVGKLLVLGFILAAAISLPTYYTFDKFPRSPYHDAVAYLQSEVNPGERIIHETKLSYFPSAYYASDLPQVFLADPPKIPNDTFELGSQQAMQIFPELDIAAAAGSGCLTCDRVYFVTFSQIFGEYAALGLTENPNLGWLKEHYHLIDRKVFSDLEIYFFER